MAKKAKIRPRKHNRPRIRQPDPKDEPTLLEQAAAVRRFNADFCAALPQHAGTDQQARGGSYVHVEGDAYDGKSYRIADGRFRVDGSDWIFTFEGGGFVEAEMATPPNFGGVGVIAIPNEGPPKG